MERLFWLHTPAMMQFVIGLLKALISKILQLGKNKMVCFCRLLPNFFALHCLQMAFFPLFMCSLPVIVGSDEVKNPMASTRSWWKQPFWFHFFQDREFCGKYLWLCCFCCYWNLYFLRYLKRYKPRKWTSCFPRLSHQLWSEKFSNSRTITKKSYWMLSVRIDFKWFSAFRTGWNSQSARKLGGCYTHILCGAVSFISLQFSLWMELPMLYEILPK